MQKLDILIRKDDQQLLQTTIFRALTDNDEFSYDMGFNFAIALTRYDSETEPFDDPTIGHIQFNHFKWGTNPDGTLFSGRYPIRSHMCTREELGLDGDKSKARFYPVTEGMLPNVDFYHKKFLCIDKEDINMYGDFSTQKA